MTTRRPRVMLLAINRKRASYRMRIEAIVSRPEFPFEVSSRHFEEDWRSQREAVAALLKHAREADVVLNSRVLLKPSALEALTATGTPLVFDYDDAVYAVPSPTLGQDRRTPWGWAKLLARVVLFGKPYLSRRHRPLIRGLPYYAAVSAGHEYLAEFARRYSSAPITIVPTVVDVRRLPVKEVNPNGPVTIGWYGAPDNQWYLRQIAPALRQVAERFGERVRLQAISATRFSHPGLNIEWVPWQPERDSAQVLQFDIGVMPYSDDEWARGKSSSKAVIYMAYGIPAVVSPVGANVVRHGETGYHAADMQAWVEALSRLVESPTLRRELGLKARQHAEANYSTEVAVKKLSAALYAAMEAKGRTGRRSEGQEPIRERPAPA